MLFIQDQAVIIGVQHFQEKHLILKVFSRHHGLIIGLYRHANKQTYLITEGNTFDIEWRARLSEHLGYFKLDLIKNIVAYLMTSRLSGLLMSSALKLLNICVCEREPQTELYDALEQLLLRLTDCGVKLLLSQYLRFELLVLKSAGFGLDLSRCIVTKSDHDLLYVSPKSGCAVSAAAGNKYKHLLFKFPKFLVDKAYIPSFEELVCAFDMLQYFIEHRFFKYMNQSMPLVRSLLLDYLKNHHLPANQLVNVSY